MLKKRLIGVIVVKDSWAVQSFGYNSYLPLGHPEYLAENLDRWGVDEILLLCIDRSRRGLGPDLSILKRLSSMGLSTPLTYGGGILTMDDASTVIQSGAERICIDAALHGEPQRIYEISSLIGAQALVAALPLSAKSQQLYWYDYRSQQSHLLNKKQSALFTDGIISEALVIDWHHEGKKNSFDMKLIHLFPDIGLPIIAFGGLSEPTQLKTLLDYPQISAVGVGNFLSYSEHMVQNLKKQLSATSLRPPIYSVS